MAYNLNITKDTKMKNKWEDLHLNQRFQPKYPSEHVVRFILTQFPMDLKERSQLKILDLGCGAGSNTILLAKEGFQTYATDISNSGLKIVRKRFKKNNLKAVLKNASMENQPFENNFFDGVISFGVFYYNTGQGYQKAIDELYRILKKGGKAFIFTRTVDDYRFGIGKKIEKNTFILDAEDTNEKGMVMYFLDKKDINKIFGKFKEKTIEKTETTFFNLKKKNSDWIIKVKK
ncbi:MAG: class I SAM-dependent methyltransferase [bacterium]